MEAHVQRGYYRHRASILIENPAVIVTNPVRPDDDYVYLPYYLFEL